MQSNERMILLAQGAKDGATLQEIAEKLGVSRERVRVLLNRTGWNAYRMAQRNAQFPKITKPDKVCKNCGKSYNNRLVSYCSAECYKVRCYRYHNEYAKKRYASDEEFRERISAYNKKYARKKEGE